MNLERNGGNHGLPTDLDIKRQIFRECQRASEALARAFAGADLAFPILSHDAARLVEQELRGLAKRTMRIIDAVAFASDLTREQEEKTPVVPPPYVPKK